jgi:plasmid stabilization system protein ParE
MTQFRVHHLVEQEYREARTWYADRSPLAAENFAIRFSHALSSLEQPPRKRPYWRKPFRRIRLVRFPYLLLYHENEVTISVLALVHERREPTSTFLSLAQRTKRWRE